MWKVVRVAEGVGAEAGAEGGIAMQAQLTATEEEAQVCLESVLCHLLQPLSDCWASESVLSGHQLLYEAGTSLG